MPWWRALPEQLAQGDVVLVTVAATQGSAPREAGTSMLVTLNGTVDTIGGGHLEWEAMAQARAMLLQPSAMPAMQRLSLGASLGQCCGGVVWLVFERIGQASRVEWYERVQQFERGIGLQRTLVSLDAQSHWSSLNAGQWSPGACLEMIPFPSPGPDGPPSPEGEGGAKHRERGNA
jgi:xanthine dehydrogenase accessory factor